MRQNFQSFKFIVKNSSSAFDHIFVLLVDLATATTIAWLEDERKSARKYFSFEIVLKVKT